MSTEDVEVVRRWYAAVNDKDLAAAADCFTPDARWTLPGRSPIAGTHVGWEQIFGQLMEITDGRISRVRGHYSDQAALDAFWQAP